MNGYTPSPRTPKGVVKVTRYNWDQSNTEFPNRIMVAKDRLNVDDTYQRVDDVRTSLVHTIRRDFDGKIFRSLLVTQRPNGEIYIIDGMHRWYAVREREDIDTVPCEFVECSSVAEEARIFLALNNGENGVSIHQKFISSLVAEDELCLSVDQMMRRVGVKLTKSTTSTGGPFVKCIDKVLRLASKDMALAERTLNVFKRLMPSGTWPGDVMMGLAYIDSRIEGVECALDNSKVVDRLVKVGIASIRAHMAEYSLIQQRTRGKSAGEKIWGHGIISAIRAGRGGAKYRLSNKAILEMSR